VPNAIQASKPDALAWPIAAGARFRPIAMTTEPVTTGGMQNSIQFEDRTRTTIRPTRKYTAPQTKIPPSASSIFGFVALGFAGSKEKPVTLSTGPIKANEEPRYEGTRPPTQMKKINVAIPEKKRLVVVGNPINSGANTVDPNIDKTCCAPRISRVPQGGRWVGLMMDSAEPWVDVGRAFGSGFLTRDQCGK